jgi:DNA-damage-inducible protein D
MLKEEIVQLFKEFESAVTKMAGIECWSARDLQLLLGYTTWKNFWKVIYKAKDSCINAGENTSDHFRDDKIMVGTRSGGKRYINDTYLTRYACYLIAQNGDSRIKEIAFAQNYFAVQTRRAEVIEQRLLEYKKLKDREELTHTEKQFSGMLFERGVDGEGFATIISKGDHAFFQLSTLQLKMKMGMPENRPVENFLPAISIKAKDLASEITKWNVQTKNLKGQMPIENEHVENNTAVRKMLLLRGIQPENLLPNDEIKKHLKNKLWTPQCGLKKGE